MLYRLIVPLLIRGDRVERGTEIELSEEQAARFDPADITPVSGEIVIEEEATAPVALEDMSHQQLKDRAKELELSAAGSKADLVERITLALQAGIKDLVEHILTEEDRTDHPEWFVRPDGEPEAQVGDTVLVPAPEEITN